MAAVVVVPPSIAETLSSTFSILTLVSILVIMIYHAVSVKKHNASRKTAKMSLIATLILFIFGLGVIMNGLILEEFVTSSVCDLNAIIGIPLYMMFKLTLYVTLALRVHYVFRNAAELEYSPKTLKIWVSIIIFWSFMNLILININFTYTFDATVYPPCDLQPTRLALMSLALQDLVSGSVNAYLFIRPVLRLKKMIKNTSSNEQSRDLHDIAIKQCVLSLSAIISTVVGLVCIILFDIPFVFVGSDVVISVLSIILSLETLSIP